jgi:hypothetical protein
LNKAVDVAKAGADAAKSGVTAAASAAASAVPGTNHNQQDSNHAQPPPLPNPELKSGPSVKSLAGKFDGKADHDAQLQRNQTQEWPRSSDRFPAPLTFTQQQQQQQQQQHMYGHPPHLHHHSAAIVSTPTTSDVFHC